MRPAATLDLTAIVVAHDSGDDLARCLESVRREAQSEGITAELVLIDNASRDGAVDRIEANFDDVTVLRNERNRGFGPAANQGFRRSRGRRILLLNPDAELQPGSLRPLLESTNDAALAAPALVLPDGRRQDSPRRFYDSRAVLAQRTPYGRSRAGVEALDHHLMRDYDGVDAVEADWVTGAAMMLDPSAVPETGPFDERYFLYFEDVDLCRRLKASGQRVVFRPDALVHHRFAAGSRRQSLRNPLLWRHLQSAALYTLRWSEGWWSSRWWRSGLERAAGSVGRTALLGGLAAAGGQLAAVTMSETILSSAINQGLLLAAALSLPFLRAPRTARLGRTPLPGLMADGSRLAVLAALILLGLGTGPLLAAISAVGWAALGAGTLRLMRLLRRRLRRFGSTWGLGHVTCLIAGEPDAAARLAEHLAGQPDSGISIAGFVPLDPLARQGPRPRLRSWDDVRETAADLRADAVLLAGSPDDLARMAGGVAELRQSGVEAAFAFTGSQELLRPERSEHTEQLAGHTLLTLGSGASARAGDAVWHGVERVAALVGLLALLPLTPILLLAARLASGRGPMQPSERVGRGLQRFVMWRLATGPSQDVDEGGGRLGALLRRLHLDELPQLWNVVRGDMSLVGPRPVEPALVDRLEPWQRARFMVRPGITGMWQLDRLRRWRLEQMVASDLLYLLRRSPSLDLRILAETLLGRRNP